MSNWLKVVIINLILFAAVLLIAEVFARFTFDNKFLTEGNQYVFFQFDENLGWRGRPGSSGQFKQGEEFDTYVKINSFGMRDREYARQKPAGVFRVAVLGDSFTWGFGVDNEEIFTEVLEKKLGSGYEVLNCGVSGFGRGQQLLYMQSDVLAFEPDALIVVAYPGNDLYDNLADNPKYEIYPRPSFDVGPDGKLLVKGVPVQEPSGNFQERLFMRHTGKWMRYYSRSYLFRIFYHLFAQINKSFDENPGDYLNEIFMVEKLERLQKETAVEKAVLAELKRILEARRIPLLYVIATTPEQVRQDLQKTLQTRFPATAVDWLQSTHLMEKAASDVRIAVFDLQPMLEAQEKEGQAVHNQKDFHWNVTGNRLVGEALSDWVISAKQAAANTPVQAQ